MTSIKYEKDQFNIVHLIFDKPNSAANIMDSAFNDDFAKVSQKLSQDNFDGVILRSEKATFFSGSDINRLFKATANQAQQVFDMCNSIKNSMRIIETCGKPVVTCINGAALGGGWEIALSSHYRIAVKDNKLKCGLPEVNLGLLPGVGGVTRMVRLLGIQNAMPYLLEGKTFNPKQGVEIGLIDQIVEEESMLIGQAINWIKGNTQQVNQAELPIVSINAQPWDCIGYKIPGGSPKDKRIAQSLPITPSLIRRKTKGTLPAPELIYATIIEGAQVDFESALRIESRYFTELATGQISKNMINTLCYNLDELNAGGFRPQGIEKRTFTHVGIIGAGSMGASIAYRCAMKGIRVTLKDVSLDVAERGKDHSRQQLNRKVKQGKMTQDQADQLLALIKPTSESPDLLHCEFVIEAVIEDRKVKTLVIKEIEDHLNGKCIFASSTSSMSISGLSEASTNPNNFIGMNFFHPVGQIELVELKCGENTSEQTLANCYDLAVQLEQTPILVNDSLGSFTSRVLNSYIKEGISMLQGAAAASIENAAYLCGFQTGPLATCDELSLTLFERISVQQKAGLAHQTISLTPHPADDIIKDMIKLGRTGKANKAGFYDYPVQSKKHLYPELNKYKSESSNIALEDLKERLLFIMAIETALCVEEGIISSTADGNISSVYGIGFPQWTGGTLQYINQYGISNFINRAEQLAQKYGDRFSVPKLLTDMLVDGKQF